MDQRGWAAGWGVTVKRMRTELARAPSFVRRSKGCIRIPASLNAFIDRYGLLDADYERAVSQGRHLWILRATRTPTPWSGRYLVIVDSLRASRPAWAPLPSGRR